jgi:hypothetical protein
LSVKDVGINGIHAHHNYQKYVLTVSPDYGKLKGKKKVNKTKYEVVEIGQTEITVDVSLLLKNEEMFFNATEMAKHFDKNINEFLRSEPANQYIDALLNMGESHIMTRDDLIRTKRGKNGGTWLHKDLAFEFAGWCSAIFRLNLHKWVEQRLKDAEDWKRKRLEAKTGYLPMTEAIMNSHDPALFYHYSTEADLINRLVLGMSAKKYKELHGVENIRDAVSTAELKTLERLQRLNTGMLELGMGYEERKEHLSRCYQKWMIE